MGSSPPHAPPSLFWFSYFYLLGPAAFNVTAQVVSQSSTWEQINITWTVSYMVKNVRVHRHYQTLHCFMMHIMYNTMLSYCVVTG